MIDAGFLVFANFSAVFPIRKEADIAASLSDSFCPKKETIMPARTSPLPPVESPSFPEISKIILLQSVKKVVSWSFLYLSTEDSSFSEVINKKIRNPAFF